MRLTPESAGLWLLLPWTRSSRVFSFQPVPAQWLLTILLGFGFDALLSFTLSLQWLSFYESILCYLKIPIGFLFPIDCVTPNPSSVHAKELKGLGFPHWPPGVPRPPYSCLSLQMVELSIYPTEHCRGAHPSLGYSHTWATESWIPPVPLPAWAPWDTSVKLPSPHFSPLFGPNWCSWKDKLAPSFSHAPGKRRESQTIPFSLSVSPFISCWQVWGIPGLHTLVTCVERVPVIYLIWSVASHNPNMEQYISSWGISSRSLPWFSETL